MIHATCPSCGKQYDLPDQAAGKKAKCKACGAVMPIPAAKASKPAKPKKQSRAPRDDDPLGLGGPPDKSKGDLSSLYGSAGGDPVAAPTAEPAGFNPSVSFANTPRKKSAALPMGLILGLGGGAVGLIVIVIVAAVVFSGGGDDGKDDAASAGGLSIAGGSVPGGSYAAGDEQDTGDADEDGDNANQETKATRSQTRLLPESPADVVDWTVQDVRAEAGRLVKPVRFRGIELLVPRTWEATSHLEKLVELGVQPSAKDAGMLMAVQPEQSTGVSIATFKSKPKAGEVWPQVIKAKTMSHTMFGSDGPYTRDHKPEDLPVIAFDPWTPQKVFVREDALVDTAFGTLFGGYPFIRLDIKAINVPAIGEGPEPRKLVCYIGYLGDTMAIFRYDVHPQITFEPLALDGIICAATLLDRAEAVAASAKDEGYLELLEEPGHRSVFGDSTPPMPGKREAGSNMLDALVQYAQATAGPADLVGPRGKGYGLTLPESLELVSTTRAAIRTEPLADGTWLSMEVHKLAGLERRQPSPIIEPGKSILLRGRRADIPAGVETTELQSDHLTLHRLLYPQVPGQTTRRVAYVAKDGPMLITLFGNLPMGDIERLAEFDAVAISIQPMADDPDDEPDWSADEPPDADDDEPDVSDDF
ncbi:MAG: hypothetical protein ACE37H_06705 [Phycisphaeraceae bacterium]